MKNNIGIIGHVDHGKTTLTAAITKVLSENSEIVIPYKGETTEPIITIKNDHILNEELLHTDFKSGRELRRERRKKERNG